MLENPQILEFYHEDTTPEVVVGDLTVLVPGRMN